MKNIHILSLPLILILAACGGKKNPLEQKKAALDKLKTEIAKLQSQAKALESEIEKIEPKEDKGKLVETENVSINQFSSYLVLNGKADAEQSTIATAQVPSTVTAVLVKAGDFVRAGQAVAYLDNAALKQSRMQIQQQIDFATILYDKQNRLWKQGVGTEVQYLAAKNQKEALEKNLATLDAQIAMYTVKSPISGSVESVDTKIGQAAAPGFPLFKIVNLSNLKVVADVSESYSSKINVGDKVFINFPDLNKKMEATISFASKIIDPLNRTFSVEVRIPNTPDVKPNMIAKLQIVDYSNKQAITVPTNCIQSAEESKYVVVAVKEKGKTIAKRKMVKTGHSGDDRTEILEGLEVSDNLIVNGYQELIDGQEITIVNLTADKK